jgi:hypothetical protein
MGRDLRAGVDGVDNLLSIDFTDVRPVATEAAAAVERSSLSSTDSLSLGTRLRTGDLPVRSGMGGSFSRRAWLRPRW